LFFTALVKVLFSDFNCLIIGHLVLFFTALVKVLFSDFNCLIIGHLVLFFTALVKVLLLRFQLSNYRSFSFVLRSTSEGTASRISAV